MKYEGKSLRHEIKYLINYQTFLILKARFYNFFELDLHSKGNGYLVRSLYFDDFYKSALYEKNYGNFMRRKFRLRMYNNDQNYILFERKSKYDNYISKESIELTRKEAEDMIAGKVDFIMKDRSEILNDYLIRHKNVKLSPQLMIDYRRTAFVDRIANIRITFDAFLSAAINRLNIFDDTLCGINVFDENLLIMEIKYDDFLPELVRKLLFNVPVQQLALSKYVLSGLMIENKGGRFYE